MKSLIPFLILASCNTQDPMRLVGRGGTELNIGKRLNVASQSYFNAGFDKNGNPRVTIRDNSEAVPIRTIDGAVTYGAAALTSNLAEAVSNNGSAEVINASNNALKTTQAKEATKQLSIKAGAATEALKIAKP